jgi:large subunit ribosomal protein L3
MKSIIGRKIGMTSVFAEDGSMYPVTVVEVLPNVVLQVKTKEKDGYEALQVGYEDKKESRANKPLAGVCKKANTAPKYVIRELEGDEIYGKYEVGSSIDASIFAAGDIVDVTAKSKGHGYTGTIKRYHGVIGPKGHGSGYHRQIGSLATNGRCNNRVHAGKKMSGQWRPQTRTVLNLAIVVVDVEKNCILIRGSVAGPKYSIMKIRSTVEHKKPFAVSPIVDYTTQTIADIERKQQEALAKANAAPKKALNPMKTSKRS